MKTWTVGFAALTVLAVGAPALAEDDADGVDWMVRSFCATCHEVPGMSPAEDVAAGPAPSFQSMADQPDVYTHDRMTAFLQEPHFPMESLDLTAVEIAGLVAYIEGLRRPGASQRTELAPRRR